MSSRPLASENADTIRERFSSLLTKVNKEHPRQTEIQALKDFLYNNKGMELWKAVIGMGELAESPALDTILNGSGQGMRECWRLRLYALRLGLHRIIGARTFAYSASNALLVKPEPDRVSAHKCDEAIDLVRLWYLLGKAVNSRAEAFHSRL